MEHFNLFLSVSFFIEGISNCQYGIQQNLFIEKCPGKLHVLLFGSDLWKIAETYFISMVNRCNKGSQIHSTSFS